MKPAKTSDADDGLEIHLEDFTDRERGPFGRGQGLARSTGADDVRRRVEARSSVQKREPQATEQFLLGVLESSAEYAIIVTTLSGEIQTWNDGARRQFGYSADEVVGRAHLRMLEAPMDVGLTRTQEALDLALEAGRFSGVLNTARKDGTSFKAQVAIIARRDRSNGLAGFLVIAKDRSGSRFADERSLRQRIAELEQQNRRLLQASQCKSQVLANMSHELRTPLTGIIGLSELMQDGGTGYVSIPQKECLTDVLSSARHLLRLLDDVLDLAKIEAGRIEFRVDELDLEAPVGEVRDVLAALAAQKHISVETRLDPGIGSVFSDATRLKQVLYNFLSNALKFTPDGGRVELRIQPENADFFRIEVEDSGIGIEPDDVNLLFLEFQQLKANSVARPKGTGLGLALTRRIVEAQGGRVSVCSQPGQGSTFIAVLPRVLVGSGDIGPGSTPRSQR